MMQNALPSEVVAVLGTIDPDANDQTTVTSDWCDMSKFDQAMCIVMVGEMAASANVDAAVLQANTSGGGGAKAITGKSITQLGGADDDKQAIINVRAEELDIAGGFRWIALRLTPTDDNSPAVAAIDSAGLVLGFGARYLPADDDLASVAEIVN